MLNSLENIIVITLRAKEYKKELGNMKPKLNFPRLCTKKFCVDLNRLLGMSSSWSRTNKRVPCTHIKA